MDLFVRFKIFKFSLRRWQNDNISAWNFNVKYRKTSRNHMFIKIKYFVSRFCNRFSIRTRKNFWGEAPTKGGLIGGGRRVGCNGAESPGSQRSFQKYLKSNKKFTIVDNFNGKFCNFQMLFGIFRESPGNTLENLRNVHF